MPEQTTERLKMTITIEFEVPDREKFRYVWDGLAPRLRASIEASGGTLCFPGVTFYEHPGSDEDGSAVGREPSEALAEEAQ